MDHNLRSNNGSSARAIQQSLGKVILSFALLAILYLVTPLPSFAQSATPWSSREGFGFSINSQSGVIVITAIVPYSPAERAGMKVRDILISADNIPFTGKSVDDVLAILRAPTSSRMAITVHRSQRQMTFQLTRSVLRVPSIVQRTRSGIPIVRITNLTKTIASDATPILKRVQAMKPPVLILDLRNNETLEYDGIDAMLGTLLPKDTLYLAPQCSQKYEYVRTTTEPLLSPDTRLIILTNRGTQAATEHFVGVLKSHLQGTLLIGEPTGGIGKSELHLKYTNGTEKVIPCSLFTPKGLPLDGLGIYPDIRIDDTYPNGDAILDAAMKAASKK